MDEMPQHAGRYAVMLRTHLWDDYVERQYQRLVSRSRGGDVFILVDETNGRVDIPHPNVVSHTQEGVLALGLSKAGYGNLLWFNGDYPLYAFHHEKPGYGYYVMVEYDVTVQLDLGDMISRLEREGVDFVGLTKGEPVAEWPHAASCLDAYRPEQVQKRLICLAAFSRRAVEHLFAKRLELSREHRAGALRRWPYCEAFIPTELGLAGFKLAELSDFGPTDFYDWKPALVETDLPLFQGQAFLHPVLDPKRYVQHTMKDVWPPEAFFYPGAEVGRRLRRVPAGVYGPPLLRALWKRAGDAVRARLATPSKAPARGQAAGRPAQAGGKGE